MARAIGSLICAWPRDFQCQQPIGCWRGQSRPATIGSSMRTVQYKAKNGAMQYRPTAAYAQRLMEQSDYPGFCLACAAEHDSVEPDARKYHCTDCGAHKVYGLEQLVLMGLVR